MLSNTTVICNHFKNPLKLFNFSYKMGEPKPDTIHKIKKPDVFDMSFNDRRAEWEW